MMRMGGKGQGMMRMGGKFGKDLYHYYRGKKSQKAGKSKYGKRSKYDRSSKKSKGMYSMGGKGKGRGNGGMMRMRNYLSYYSQYWHWNNSHSKKGKRRTTEGGRLLRTR
jgi:hypothetical protein